MDAAGSKEKYLAALPWAIDITDAMLDAFEAADALRKWSSPRSVSDKAKAGYEAFLVATKHFQWDLLHAPHAADLFDPDIVAGKPAPVYLKADISAWYLSWDWALQTRRKFVEASDRRRAARKAR